MCEEGFDGVARQVGAVVGSRFEAAKLLGNLIGGDLPDFRPRPPDQQFGEQRTAGDGSDTAPRLKPGGHDAAVFHANREPKHIAADGIGSLHHAGGVGKWSRISRVLEMIEHGRAEHDSSMAKAAPARNAQSSDGERARAGKPDGTEVGLTAVSGTTEN